MRLLDERELLEMETNPAGLYPPPGVVAGTRWSFLVPSEDRSKYHIAVTTWMYQTNQGQHFRQMTVWQLEPETCTATCVSARMRLPEESTSRMTARVPKRHVQVARSILRHYLNCKRTHVRVELTGEQVRSARTSDRVHLSMESESRSPRVTPVVRPHAQQHDADEREGR